MTYHEPFGPIYARSVWAACPDCECCTKALCDKAREQKYSTMRDCSMHSHDSELVKGCPCPTRGAEVKRAACINCGVEADGETVCSASCGHDVVAE